VALGSSELLRRCAKQGRRGGQLEDAPARISCRFCRGGAGLGWQGAHAKAIASVGLKHQEAEQDPGDSGRRVQLGSTH
jgi:hypothetical protein